MTSARFAVSKLQYHENGRDYDGMEGYTEEEVVLSLLAVRSWNNSLLIICIIWAEIDTVRNKIIEIIIRHKVDTMLEICPPNEISVNLISCAR